jgi:hypothetical protein
MFEFIAGVIAGTAATALTVMWILARARRAVNDMLNQMITEIEQEQQQAQTVISVHVEQHGEQFYLYNHDTMEFIAQGHDAAELEQRTSRTRQTLNVVSGDPTVVARLRATLS